MAGKGLFSDLILPPEQMKDRSLADLFRYYSTPGGYGSFPGGLNGASKAPNDLLPPPKNSLGNSFLLASLNPPPSGYGLFPATPADTNVYLNALAALGALNTKAPLAPPQWIAVERRFRDFHKALAPNQNHEQEVWKKASGIIECLNRSYYGIQNEIDHGFYAGSWGKGTAIYPWSDLDLYYVVPYSTYVQFQSVESNRQSRLLQHVKNVLVSKYSRTEISADGQVVVVEFDRLKIEVVPAILLTQPGRYWICNTKAGGSYTHTAPVEEQQFISQKDRENGNNVRPLSRMLKVWRYTCNVPIEAFHLEMMAAAFLEQSRWRLKGWFYYDWIIRDFFEFMPRFKDAFLTMPGTGFMIGVGSAWVSYANTAYGRAVHAAEYEKSNRVVAAGLEWQKIFGDAIPRE